MSKFRKRQRTLRTGLSVQPISRTPFIRCEILDGCRRFSWCQLFSHPKWVTQEKRSTEDVLAPDSLIHPVSKILPMGFSLAMSFCPDVTDHCTFAGSADLLFLSVLATPHHRCSVAGVACDRLVSAGRVLTNLGFWLTAQTPQTNVFISDVSCRCTESWSRCSRCIRCQRKCRCSRL